MVSSETGTVRAAVDATAPDDAGAPSEPVFRYAAFLSYSHRDRRAAARLHSFLESYRIPRDLVGRVTPRGIVPDRLRPIFRDREDLAAAHDLSIEIDEALTRSRSLIVLCSPHAAVSRWANIEVERFKSLHGDAKVFAAIIAGEPFASDHPARAADECFPPALRQRQTPNGPVRTEPVGADLRRDGDGQHAGQLKLVAGIIGVPLDELVHRDARRRQRRTLALVVALLLGLALTSALALFALQARNEAQRQRAEAEGLIEFMVSDLRKKLEPIGRLGAMDSLGERALAFYQRQDTASLDPDSLGRRARVVQLIGEIQDQRGNLDTALANFETAAATTAELLARDPDSPQRIFDNAQSVYYVGYIAFRRGDFAKAEQAFQTYLDLANRLVAQDAGNVDWQAEQLYALSNLATLRHAEGRNAEASALFEQVLALSRTVAARSPDDSAAALSLATSLAWAAYSHERLGALDKTLVERAEEDRVLAAERGRDPDNRSAQLMQVESLRAQTRVAQAQGRLGDARAIGETATKLATKLIDADPQNTVWLMSAANARLQFAEVMLASGDISGAAAQLAGARDYTSTLATRDRSVARWQLLRIHEGLIRAAIYAARGEPALALGVARAAGTAIDSLPAAGRDDSDRRWLRARTQLQISEALLALAAPTEARAALLAVANAGPATGSVEEPRMMVLRARALMRLGDTKAAADLNRRLRAMGLAPATTPSVA